MIRQTQQYVLICVVTLCLTIPPFALHAQEEITIPYPPSNVILDVVFDWTTHVRSAQGSDNWAITWAGDDHQYTTWGDGGGFGSVNSDGRVSLGVARIEGDAQIHTGFNIWGGAGTVNPAQFPGKSYGIISIGNVLYMWVSPWSGINNYTEARLAYSTDWGASWTRVDWAFTQEDGLALPTMLQFGKDYAGARDEYVYHYAIRLKDTSQIMVQTPGEIDLMRVPHYRMLERGAYEFFAGMDEAGEPIWTLDVQARMPVFQDANGVGWTVSVSYNAGLNRYLLITEHGHTFGGNMGIFDAPEPWGNWSTVEYYSNWGDTLETFFWNFSNKWLSEDGRAFTLIYTGIGAHDSWNTVKGHFVAVDAEPELPLEENPTETIHP